MEAGVYQRRLERSLGGWRLVDVGATHTPTQVTTWVKSGKETATDDSISLQAPLTRRLTEDATNFHYESTERRSLHSIIFAATLYQEIKTLGCDTVPSGRQISTQTRIRARLVAPQGMQLKLRSFWLADRCQENRLKITLACLALPGLNLSHNHDLGGIRVED